MTNLTLADCTEPDAHGQQCPAWCTMPGTEPDPYHFGDYSSVSLSLSGDPDTLLLARLEKGLASPDTYVAIVHKDRYDLDLTLAEAGELAELLTTLVRVAAED